MTRRCFVSVALLMLSLGSCKKDSTRKPGSTSKTELLLKAVTIRNLPSPYYQFSYKESGDISNASYSSGALNYSIQYVNNQISEIKNNTTVNQDRLQYEYHDGKVLYIKYINGNGELYKRCFLIYNDVNQLESM